MNYSYEITTPKEDGIEYVSNMLLEFNLQAKSLTQEKSFITIKRCIKDQDGMQGTIISPIPSRDRRLPMT